MEILKVFLIILEVLLLFNLLIFVHELGHFLAGRWRGLKIERFAIWFGKPIWKKKINGVEYVLGCIPAGGYVSLPQMAPMEMIEGQASKDEPEGEGAESAEPQEPQDELPPITALDKIIVAIAGPLFSFLLAIAFALVVWGVGRPVSEAEVNTTIGYVDKEGPAAEAGLLPGDIVRKVDGRKVTKFGGMGDSIIWRVISSEGETIPIEVVRDGKVLPPIEVTPVVPETKLHQRKALRQIRIFPAVSTLVGAVTENSPAAMKGLMQGDEIVQVDDLKPKHWRQVQDYIQANSEKTLRLMVKREGEVSAVELKPEKPMEPPDAKPLIGISFAAGGKMTLVRPGPVQQVKASVNAMVETFAALFSRKSDVSAQHLGGAIKIINVYYLLFKSEDGWRLALWFSVLMNVNLALLNMLPIPVLDGGHIVLAIVEAIRRKPVSLRVLQWVQTGCAGALILFMLYIAFFDAQDLSVSQQPEIRFAPKPVSEFEPLR